jgi:hypothetical protein
MIPNLISTILLLLGIPTVIAIVFIPTLLELKRPRDMGPRIIMEHFNGKPTEPHALNAILKIDDDHRLNQALLFSLGRVIEFLPSLEV